VSLHGRREGLPTRTVLIPVESRPPRRPWGRWLVALLAAAVLAVAVATIVAIVRYSPAKPRTEPRTKPPPVKTVRPHRTSAAVLMAQEQQHAIARLAGLGVPVFCGAANVRDVALTFDDGPGPYTGQVLAILRRYGAQATFFVVGNRIRYWPRLPALEAAAGAVGEHTWSHADLTRLPRAAARREIDRPPAAIGGRVRLFRTPYGHAPGWLGRYLAARDMLEIRWTVDSDDYLPHATASKIVRRVAGGLRPGAIVLLHDIQPATVRALPRLLALIRSRHLRAVTVPELLRRDPPSYAQLMADSRGRGCVDLATARRE
jgi:peptidoglycan/xylan/chitin deacetylase (PgdA/CDA1 family)